MGYGCTRNMGMGRIGTGDVVFKRKFRWQFSIQTNTGLVPPSVVKVAARPSLTIEETEINYLNAKMWIPGKGSWETITVTYYDVTGPQGQLSAFEAFTLRRPRNDAHHS